MEKEKKKKLGVAAVFAVVAAALIIGGVVWFVPHQRAVDSFNNAASGLESRNEEVDSRNAFCNRGNNEQGRANKRDGPL